MQVHSSTTYTVCIQRASGVRHKAPGAPPSAATPPRNSPGCRRLLLLTMLSRPSHGVSCPLLKREWKGTSVSREEWG
jgi:hypothetical protein